MAYSKDVSVRLVRPVSMGGDNTIVPWLSQGQVSRVIVMSQSGTSNPRYKQQIAKQVNATTPYSKQYLVVSKERPCNASVTIRYPKYATDPSHKVPVTFWARSSGPWHFAKLDGILAPASGSTAYPQARNMALKFLYNRHADISSAFQGGVFAGELRETWRLLKSPLGHLKKGIFGYLDDVQHRLARDKGFIERIPKKRRTKWINDMIADSWLTATLGFLPLCHDIDDAFKALSNMYDRSETFGLTATGKSEAFLNESSRQTFVNNYIYTKVHVLEKTKASVRFKAGFRLSPAQIDERTSMAGQLSLTVKDFVPTVWNLIPGSFLYDYFTNIGDILDANANPLVGMTYITESIKTELITEIETLLDLDYIKSQFSSVYLAAGGDTGGATVVAHRFQRVIPTELLPTLQVSVDLGDRQALNVAALLQKGNIVRLLTLGLIK